MAGVAWIEAARRVERTDDEPFALTGFGGPWNANGVEYRSTTIITTKPTDVIDHGLQASVDGHSWSVQFPVYIDATYHQGKCDEHGVGRQGYAAEAPFIETPRQARYH